MNTINVINNIPRTQYNFGSADGIGRYKYEPKREPLPDLAEFNRQTNKIGFFKKFIKTLKCLYYANFK